MDTAGPSVTLENLLFKKVTNTIALDWGYTTEELVLGSRKRFKFAPFSFGDGCRSYTTRTLSMVIPVHSDTKKRIILDTAWPPNFQHFLTGVIALTCDQRSPPWFLLREFIFSSTLCYTCLRIKAKHIYVSGPRATLSAHILVLDTLGIYTAHCKPWRLRFRC